MAIAAGADKGALLVVPANWNRRSLAPVSTCAVRPGSRSHDARGPALAPAHWLDPNYQELIGEPIGAAIE